MQGGTGVLVAFVKEFLARKTCSRNHVLKRRVVEAM
jgi:hypothetical protein